MRVLFVLSNSETAFWLSELTSPSATAPDPSAASRSIPKQPERRQGRVGSYGDPCAYNSTEPPKAISSVKGSCLDKTLVAKTATLRLRDVNLVGRTL